MNTVYEQVTTISFFQYNTFKSKLWAFGMMQYAHAHLSKAKGCTFYKLMGTGKGNGFNPWPDFSTYSLLMVWDSIDEAEVFINNSTLYARYNDQTSAITTHFMHCLKSHGEWSKQNPFKTVTYDIDESNNIGVITRATIKKRFLPKFWSYVPTSSKPLKDNENLLFKKGIGETPILQMATFSIWEEIDAIKQYAYKSKEHAEAIKITRKLGWYKEELFARFVILKESKNGF